MNAAVIDTGSPISPASMSCLVFEPYGMKRHVWAYIRFTPDRSAAAIISSASRTVTEKGFSTMTCLPASAAMTAVSRCEPEVTTSTASTAGSATSSSRLANALTPSSPARSAAAASFTS